MEYLPIRLNKLVQAIISRDWQAVKKICETEEHLINTYYDDDKDYETPLIYAAVYHAPDDIMQNMIEKATQENLEYRRQVGATTGGSTILHFLALTTRVTPLRSALERTKNANVKDDVGRTPLHYCLCASDNNDEHRDTAVCLMMHGALISIKNAFGKTPLDVYDDTEYSEDEETTSEEKCQSLRKLLIELSVPGEILARGENAVKAFEYEMQNGEISVVNARFMFLGKEGVGKTSCVNHILGKAFNENEQSTDGIVTTTVFQTFGEDCSEWETTNVDVCELTKQIKEGAIAENIAKKLKQPESKQSTSSNSASSLTGKVEEATTVMTLNERGNSQEPQGDGSLSTHQSTRSHNTFEKTLPDRLHKMVVNRLADQGTSNVGPSEVTSIWDYAGQLKYYITHRIYLTGGASYGVVFSLLDDLNDLIKTRDLHKGELSMTNLQMILFWMRSIFEHAVLPNMEKKTIFFNAEISSPPISLIATHKDQLSKSEAETRINTMFHTIFDAIKGTAYETHVDRTIYAVDNTAKMDEGIETLKKNVGGYMKAMARTVPTSWVDFQSKVQELGKTRLRVSLDEITSVATECGISKSTLTTVLDYLNDTGIVLYSKTNEKLKNTVITNLRMMIDFLTKIITVVTPDDIDK
ncbi:uncharacterized protein LOC117120025, partial [Anneissia japonica]|uniref:uncharacterized protein LOC117120025 n=1 Tax=Anneissia japonica TaxID=1529436 RepID=UPI0014255678